MEDLLRKNLAIIRKGNTLTELRVVSQDKKVHQVLRTRDTESLVKAAMNYDGKAHIYISLNPIAETTPDDQRAVTDQDIEKRNWLLIDIDSKSPGSAIQDHAQIITDFLSQEGWPLPIMADSGYGIHLLYPIDLKNDDHSTKLIKSVLRCLDHLFSTEDFIIDQKVGNASRLVRFYGTINVKSTHRTSSILKEVPNPLGEVTENQFESFIAKYDQEKNVSEDIRHFNLSSWISENGIVAEKKARWKGIADRYILNPCPFDSNHTNQSAYIIQFDNGAIIAGCHHNGCKDKTWRDLRNLYQKESAHPIESSPSSILIALSERAEYYRDDLEEGYAAVQIQGHKEVYKVRSSRFRKWLTLLYYKQTGKAPSTEALSQAMSVIETKALFEGKPVSLSRRVARDEDKFFYDVGDENWTAVQLEPGQWRILTNPPVLFIRSKNTKGQLLSENGADVHLLDKHFRFGSPDQMFLFKVYLIHCLIPDIPHLIAIFHGEKGASKTTSVRKTRRLIDPSSRDLLTMPKGKNELALILANNYMPSFDNLEKLQSHQSELLCIASTGGGLSKRTLYTDEDETILDFKRCVVLNGINVVATRPDLLDRAILLELERIPPRERREEAALWQEFENDLPYIFSGMLNTVCKAMAIYPSLQLKELPRMADASKWGYAIAISMGDSGERFLRVYKENQKETNKETIADHPVAAAIVLLMENHNDYRSSVSELLNQLEKIAMKEKINTLSMLWPKASNVLSKRLKEVKSNLSEIGIEFSFINTKNSTQIHLTSVRPEEIREGEKEEG